MHHNHHHAAHPSAEHVARLSEHVHHPCGRPDHHGDGRAIADIRNIKPPKIPGFKMRKQAGTELGQAQLPAQPRLAID